MNHFEQVLALIVWTIASARITRLVIFDHYPPMVWLRITWDRYTGNSSWNLLLHCGYCLAPWVALVAGALGCWSLGIEFSTLVDHWWLAVCVWLSVAYLAAITVAYDGED